MFASCYQSSRPLHEGVDWNYGRSKSSKGFTGRPLHEGVDWNIIKSPYLRIIASVALFMRAWIEIGTPTITSVTVSVALFMRAWIEMKGVENLWKAHICRPLHEGVDWNRYRPDKVNIAVCRPLHEGVDWNCTMQGKSISGRVTLFTRAWIEIQIWSWWTVLKSVALFMRAWIEI